jgi:hypothetical protein
MLARVNDALKGEISSSSFVVIGESSRAEYGTTELLRYCLEGNGVRNFYLDVLRTGEYESVARAAKNATGDYHFNELKYDEIIFTALRNDIRVHGLHVDGQESCSSGKVAEWAEIISSERGDGRSIILVDSQHVDWRYRTDLPFILPSAERMIGYGDVLSIAEVTLKTDSRVEEGIYAPAEFKGLKGYFEGLTKNGIIADGVFLHKSSDRGNCTGNFLDELEYVNNRRMLFELKEAPIATRKNRIAWKLYDDGYGTFCYRLVVHGYEEAEKALEYARANMLKELDHLNYDRIDAINYSDSAGHTYVELMLEAQFLNSEQFEKAGLKIISIGEVLRNVYESSS